MNTNLILTNLGLADDTNVLGLIKESNPIKFLISDDKLNQFYKLLALKNDNFNYQDRRRVVSIFGSAFKQSKFHYYHNFMGKLTPVANSPLNMMYGPELNVQVGGDINMMKRDLKKAAIQLQKYPNHHIKILGTSSSVYEIILKPNQDGTLMNIDIKVYFPDDQTLIEPVTDHSKQGRSDLINSIHLVNKNKSLPESEERLHDSINRLKLNRNGVINVQPIDFDAPNFPQDVLDIMRTYDDLFDNTVGAKEKSIIMENTGLFVSRTIAFLGREPEILFQLIGDKYVVNDYSKVEPLVNHVMTEMSTISSKFFK